MKKIFSLFAALLFVGNMMAETFSLEKVTAVEAGKSYVFVRNNCAIKGEAPNKKLLSTSDFLTEGLEGTEIYVWTLETATKGFFMKAGGKYMNNQYGGTDISFGTNASSDWEISFERE